VLHGAADRRDGQHRRERRPAEHPAFAVGRRRIFRIGLVVFCVGSLACSLAPSLPALIAFRALQGVGGSMLTPSTLAIVANTFTDERERARAIGVWSATSGLSIGLGPVIGGGLVQAVGWPSVFWVNLPIGAVALAASGRWIEESRAARPRRMDVPGQLCSTAALASVTYGLIEAPEAGWAAPGTIGVLLAGIGLAAGFLLLERHRREPLLELRFFADPDFTASIVVAFVAFLGMFTFIFFNTLYLQEVLQDGALTSGLMTMAATGPVVLAAPCAGRFVAVHGPFRLTAVACLLMASGLVLVGFTDPSAPRWALLCAYLVFGVGIGFVNPPITNEAVAGMPREQAGVASATASAARQMGGVFGVALIGSIVFSKLASGLQAGAARGTVDLLSLPPDRRHAAAVTFASAIHLGYRLAAAFLLLGAVVAARAMRPSAKAAPDRGPARDRPGLREVAATRGASDPHPAPGSAPAPVAARTPRARRSGVSTPAVFRL
jgi:EmrB/QacA subfamily drug resistance transporter